KTPSTTDVASLNTFGRNEIEVAPISSALLRIACLVILYKTCRVPDQELAADGLRDFWILYIFGTPNLMREGYPLASVPRGVGQCASGGAPEAAGASVAVRSISVR